MAFTKSSVAVWWFSQLLLLTLFVPVSSRSQVTGPTDQKREHEVEVVLKLLIDVLEFCEISVISEG